VRIAAIAITLIACKSDAPPTTATSASGSASVTLAPKQPSGSLASMMPTLPSAKVLTTKAPNDAYALATWCIDEADAVAKITAALERDGWTAVRTRGEPSSRDRSRGSPGLGIAAMKGDVRFSARTGGSDSRCAGTYVTATVVRLGNIDAKLLEGADKIR